MSCEKISIEEFLRDGYAEPIDLSTIPDFQEKVQNDELPIDKRTRQVANGEWSDRLFPDIGNIIFSLLNITEPEFILKDEFNTISIFYDTYGSNHPDFKELLIQYLRNTNEDKDVEKARMLKSIIMQFIADKMNNGK
jgi:hypothetical protein